MLTHNILKILTRIIFFIDSANLYIFKEPHKLLMLPSFKNYFYNIFFYLINFKFKKFFISSILLIFFVLTNILKILYAPLILILYFSKYRFIQLDYSQIGALNQNLHYMVKKNLIGGYKSIILIPKLNDFSFIKNIFKDLIIIDNLFFNIILLPLKHTNLVSVTNKKLEIFINSKYELRNHAPFSKIYNEYSSKKKNNPFKLNSLFIKKMKYYVKKNYPKLNISNTYVVHHREYSYLKNFSELRGSNIDTYLPSYKYLLNKGYGLVRLVSSSSKKFFFNSNKYIEINTDFSFNKKLQYYLLLKCKGFITSSSGPGSIGPLLSVPVYETNIIGPNTFAVTPKSIFILKKIKFKNKILKFKQLLKIGFYNNIFISSARLKYFKLKVIDNSPKEILGGLKEFVNLKKKNKPSKSQVFFKKSLPEYMEYKYYNSNVSKSYLKENKNIFI